MLIHSSHCTASGCPCNSFIVNQPGCTQDRPDILVFLRVGVVVIIDLSMADSSCGGTGNNVGSCVGSSASLDGATMLVNHILQKKLTRLLH